MFAVALLITFVMEKGATFQYVLTVKTGEPPEPLDITGCAAQMLIKPDWESATIYEDLSTANGMLFLTGEPGEIGFEIPKSHTLAATWRKGVCALYLDWPDDRTWTLGRGPAFVEVGTR